jgi:hypothetical protein
MKNRILFTLLALFSFSGGLWAQDKDKDHKKKNSLPPTDEFVPNGSLGVIQGKGNGAETGGREQPRRLAARLSMPLPRHTAFPPAPCFQF